MNVLRTLALSISLPVLAGHCMADETRPAIPVAPTAANTAVTATANTATGTKAGPTPATQGTLVNGVTTPGGERSTSTGTIIIPPKPPKKEALEAAKAGALKAKAAQH